MAKLWPPKDLPKVAVRLILSQLVVILAGKATLSHLGITNWEAISQKMWLK